MDQQLAKTKRADLVGLVAVMVLFVVVSVIGIGWGLPSREVDRYLFGADEPWTGRKIYELAGAGEKFLPTRGADVDMDALESAGGERVLLTDSDEDLARIYLRYRLYTHQPDEMITMMALAGMRPRTLQLDPRLYQYGGLFIYPVGAIIGLCDLVGLIDVRSDVVFYLDHPEEFGKFYIASRAYSAGWGLLGVFVVFAIGRRFGSSRAGILAALLYTLMPVVVCMAHEGKPHLPGAVLMLLAVLFGMRSLDRGSANAPKRVAGKVGSDWWLMCICCGAALGMVLSSWPVFVLIPVVALMRSVRPPATDSDRCCVVDWGGVIRRSVVGVLVGATVYLVTNPYVAINLLTNFEVLQSNFGNSLGMYHIAHVGAGFLRVLVLTVEGATLPLVVIGFVATCVALCSRRQRSAEDSAGEWRCCGSVGHMLPLAITATVFFLQFVLIGAGKPAEYGRFGVFTDAALAIAVACALTRGGLPWRSARRWVPIILVVLWTGTLGVSYLRGFHNDVSSGDDSKGSRAVLAREIESWLSEPSSRGQLVAVEVPSDPAPYCCPPLPFAKLSTYLSASPGRINDRARAPWTLHIRPVDRLRAIQTPWPIKSRRRLRPDFYGYPPPATGVDRVLSSPSRISWADKPFELTISGAAETSR